MISVEFDHVVFASFPEIGAGQYTVASLRARAYRCGFHLPAWRPWLTEIYGRAASRTPNASRGSSGSARLRRADARRHEVVVVEPGNVNAKCPKEQRRQRAKLKLPSPVVGTHLLTLVID